MTAPRPFRALWLLAGFVLTGLGFLGLILPLMPGTVFFVLAAACFARSSPRFETWLLNLPAVGPLVRDYRAGRGMPARAKLIAVLSIIVAVLLTLPRIPVLPGRLVWLLLGLYGIWYVTRRVPTRAEPPAGER
ncbi:YbaN family protein [Deinococcus maricopensis]|uniref:Inner membrane protein YbaN n=1 Tax=Deinococcus maricopensis (strain DSM 21211 / LMG 22137 / NRRL B-23946 / LB-34) TaxID=709986 RepID=E8U695_DEIML|nr:YbaN family protein [Deinococcus maricopensis]ADV66584.1 protein of unknown function DUF454 [Deinococcus maricopensis DSM 21211]